MTKNEGLECCRSSGRVELPFSDLWTSKDIKKLCGPDGIVSGGIPDHEETK